MTIPRIAVDAPRVRGVGPLSCSSSPGKGARFMPCAASAEMIQENPSHINTDSPISIATPSFAHLNLSARHGSVSGNLPQRSCCRQ